MYRLSEILRATILVGAAVSACAVAAAEGKDPFDSGQWSGMEEEFLSGQKVAFDDRVKVTGPRFAEDAMNVPVSLDATALGEVRRVMVLVDRNPIRKVLEFFPLRTRPTLAFRFKLQQSSPVRVAALGADGVWHVGSTWVDASGGGCTAPGATRASGTWHQTLGQSQARFFGQGDATRLRLRVMHPMDTGLVAGIPAFYLEELALRDEAGTEYLRLQTFEPVSENPVFSFDLPEKPVGKLVLSGRDNNGNRVAAGVAP
ncbi:MAG TPA: quinoprotein dehydrogenase-associated SoxYZ-like carrier [Rhodocyclaceae bacterium]|nr:quinoprotein dehydrogenase-associated SoxYZ-like carrier [Rhodocyclaceae bacterium]